MRFGYGLGAEDGVGAGEFGCAPGQAMVRLPTCSRLVGINRDKQVSSFKKQVIELQDVDLQQRVCYGFSPYSLLNQGVTPDTYYSLFKTVRKDTTFL